MAPLAASPGVLRGATPEERRRWVLAAATTGLLLVSPVTTRDGTSLERLPERLREAIDGEVPAASTPADDPFLLARAASAASEETAPPTTAPAGDPVGTGALPDGPAELARAGDVALVTEGSSVELVGFHESSDGGALPLTSAHPLVSLHPDVDGDVPDDDGPVVALPTRHRAGAATSAIDLAVTAGQEVPAPVSGEVVAVDDFALYGETADVKIQIRPDADPSVLVSVIHVVDAQVAVGDQVEAGTTALAAEARQLPFESQVDRFTAAHRGQAAPHVHIEVHPAGA